MVIFEAIKSDLLQVLNQIRTSIRTRRYKIYYEADFLIQPGRLVIKIDGAEAYCKISNEGVGMFDMHFMDFFQAIDSSLEDKNEKIYFVLNDKNIQIGKRKLSYISANFDYQKVLKTIEAPLSSLNYDVNEDNQYYKSFHSKEYCLLLDINEKFNSDTIEKDINFLEKYLKKYKISRREISDFIYQKMYEIDKTKLF
jgi:hypothetical protein